MPWSNTQYILLSAGDFVLTAIFYYFYRQRRYLWKAVQSAALISSNTDQEQLAKLLYGDGKSTPGRVYVAIDGSIEPAPPNRKGESVQVITSEYRPELTLRGVYRVVTHEERHLRRAAGNWYDVSTTVSSDVGHVPACVVVNLPNPLTPPPSRANTSDPSSSSSQSALVSILSSTVHYSLIGWETSKKVALYPLNIFGGKSGDSTTSGQKDAVTSLTDSSPKNQLLFTLPPLHLAEESILQESCLTQVHSDFEEKNHSIIESLGQVIFGNVLIGTIRRERLLLAGTRVYVLANLDPAAVVTSSTKAASSTSAYRLTISSHGGDEVPFIITCIPPEQLASRLKRPAVIYGVLSLIGFGCLCAIAAKWWYERREGRMVAERARALRSDALNRRREKLQSSGIEETPSASDIDTMCVICLDARRDVALLPCGHVCMCANCYAQLPSPTCPLCRAEVTGTAPLFFS